jgi:hypothetical protein
MSGVSREELLSWDLLSPQGLTSNQLKSYQARVDAVHAVVAGSSIAAVAKRHGLNAKTLALTLRNTQQTSPDGRPWGWRACLPYRVRNTSQRLAAEFPAAAGPGAFNSFLRKLPEFEEMLIGYAGPLPSRNERSPKFDRFFKLLKKTVQKSVPADRYPANDKSCARRSVLQYLKRLRQGSPFVDDGFEIEDATLASQLNEVFALQMGDWVQFDGHSLDTNFNVEGEDADGNPFFQTITKTWLIVGYFALMRLCSSWWLSFSTNYNGTEFNAACAESLRERSVRDLVVPSMNYEPGACIGSLSVIGFVATGAITSVDNAMAHKLKVNRLRMASELMGVIHLGHSHVPETRGHLEAWNKRMEEAVVRKLPGGFRPAGELSDATKTNGYKFENFPMQPTALEDLMDVTIAASNISPINTLQNRTPVGALQSFAASGGWLFATKDHEDRARSLSKHNFSVTIRGDRRKRRQPYARFGHAKYRAASMKNRWDLLGQKFAAEVDIHDGRFLHLYTASGELFVVLRALRPWGRSPHSLALRRLIQRRSRTDGFEISGAEDAVIAYREHVRRNFSSEHGAALAATRHRRDLDAASEASPVAKETTLPLAETGQQRAPAEDLFVPITGRVNLGRKGPKQ